MQRAWSSWSNVIQRHMWPNRALPQKVVTCQLQRKMYLQNRWHEFYSSDANKSTTTQLLLVEAVDICSETTQTLHIPSSQVETQIPAVTWAQTWACDVELHNLQLRVLRESTHTFWHSTSSTSIWILWKVVKGTRVIKHLHTSQTSNESTTPTHIFWCLSHSDCLR